MVFRITASSLGLLTIIFITTLAQAELWYLMAPHESLMALLSFRGTHLCSDQTLSLRISSNNSFQNSPARLVGAEVNQLLIEFLRVLS